MNLADRLRALEDAFARRFGPHTRRRTQAFVAWLTRFATQLSGH